MKKIVVSMALLAVVQLAVGQDVDPRFAKLEKLYQKGKYEKCAKLADKLRQKMRNEAAPYVYLSMIQFQKFDDSHSTGIKTTALKKTLKHAEKAKRNERNNNLQPYLAYFETLRKETESFGTFLLEENKQRNAEVCFEYIATLYGDTIDAYRALLLPVVEVEEVVEDIPTTPSTAPLTIEEGEVISNLPGFNRVAMIGFADELVGIPYVYGGETTKGFDCSGFTKYVYAHMGVDLPHNAHRQSKLGRKVAAAEAQAGDLIFFGSRSGNSYRTVHAGLVHANDNGQLEVIHCVSGGVSIDGSDSTSWTHYWKDRMLFVKRLVE